MVEIITFDDNLKRIAMSVCAEIVEVGCHSNGQVYRIYFMNFFIDIDRAYTEIEIYQDGVNITETIKKTF